MSYAGMVYVHMNIGDGLCPYEHVCLHLMCSIMRQIFCSDLFISTAGETSSRIAALSIGTPIVFFSLITVVALIVILCKRHKCFKTCRVPTRQATELELDPVEDLPPYSVSEVYPDRALLYPDTAITGCVYPHPAKIYPQAYSGPCVPLEYPPHPAAK